MTPTEAVALVRVLQATCPAQLIDDHTPDAWSSELGALEFDDAVAVVRHLGGRQPFVPLCDIVDGVREIRLRRLGARPEPAPAADPDDPAAYVAALRRQRQAIGSGHTPLELTP